MNTIEQQIATVMPDIFGDSEPAAPPPDLTAPDTVIGEGQRNATLTRAAGAMRRAGLNADAIAAALLVMNDQRCRPPLPTGEVETIARSVERYQPARDDRDSRIEVEVEQQRIKREARKRLDAEERGAIERPDLLTLRELLAQPEPEEAWRIEHFQRSRTRTMLIASAKAGKTTMRNALVASLVDGVDFLGARVTPVRGTVCILDTEMSKAMTQRWLRASQIRCDDKVIVALLRGRLTTLNLLDDTFRASWALWLLERGVEYLILDNLRPVFDAIGLDEHREAGRFLHAFDQLLVAANIQDALLVHHMGHSGERARGDSRLSDWPDATWKLVKAEDAEERYIVAYGRDVDVPESRLDYDPISRRLSLNGGSRRDVRAEAALADVLAILKAEAPLSRRGIESACHAGGSEFGRDTIRAAIAAGIRSGDITTEAGARRAVLHQLSERASARALRGECATSRTAHSGEGVRECAAASLEAAHTHTPQPRLAEAV